MLPLPALPVLGLGSKLIILMSLFLISNVFVAYKTHNWTADSYEQKIQADKYITVVKTAEIQVLDQKSLTSALIQQKAQLEKDFENEREILRFLQQNPAAANCDIGADGLRLWNNENRGVEVR